MSKELFGLKDDKGNDIKLTIPDSAYINAENIKPTEKDIINDYHGGPVALMILITMFVAFVIGVLVLFLKAKWCVPVLVIILLFLGIFVAGRLMADLYVKYKK